MFWVEIWKISNFLSENFQFLEVKFSIYMNRRVFVMRNLNTKFNMTHFLTNEKVSCIHVGYYHGCLIVNRIPKIHVRTKPKTCDRCRKPRVIIEIVSFQSTMGQRFKVKVKLLKHYGIHRNQGPAVQSVVSLTSSLRVISLTVLADSIYNILKFFAEKMWVAFALQKLLTFFQQKNSAKLKKCE